MADFLATNEFPGTGAVMQVEINFAGLRPDLPGNPAPYLETDDVKAVIVTPATAVSVEVQVPVDLVKVNNTTFNTDVTVVPIGQVLRVYRATDIEFPLVDFVSLQVVSESDLDNQARQVLYAVMESSDNAQIAIDRASFAAEVAVTANLASINAVDQAGAAVATANAASAAAAAAVVTANAANVKSDEALAAAAAAEAHADAVETLAAEAAQDADDAAASALEAVTTAGNALSVANAIDAKAQSALDASATAVGDAATALSTANAIDAKAQTALDNSATAISTANAATATANAIDAKAQSALDASAAAVDAAADADANANTRQPADATLTALAAVTLAADKLIYGTGGETAALTDLTATGRDLIGSASITAVKAKIGLPGRNVIINGNCRIAQRTTGTFTAGQAGYGGPDRFYTANGATGVFTQASSTLTIDGVSRYTVKQQVSTAASSFASGNYWLGIDQRIEGSNCRHLLGKACTLSFWFSASIAGTYSAAISAGESSNSFVSSFSIPVANTPTFITIPIATLPTTLPVVDDVQLGLIVVIGAQNSGTYATSTLNEWQAGQRFVASGATVWGTTVGANIALTRLQLEPGPGSEFEDIPFERQLAECQRYYEITSNFFYQDTPSTRIFHGRPTSFSTTKRAGPTLGVSQQLGLSNIYTYQFGSSITTSGFQVLWQNDIAGASSGLLYVAAACEL